MTIHGVETSSDALPGSASEEPFSRLPVAVEELRMTSLALADAVDRRTDQELHRFAAQVRSSAEQAVTCSAAADEVSQIDLELLTDELAQCVQLAAVSASVGARYAPGLALPVIRGTAVFMALELLFSELARWGDPVITITPIVSAEVVATTKGREAESVAEVQIVVPGGAPGWAEVGRLMSAFLGRLRADRPRPSSVIMRQHAITATSERLEIRVDDNAVTATFNCPIGLI